METKVNYMNFKKTIPDSPVIFLAGPIKNAPEWREEMINIFLEKNKKVFIASPEENIEQLKKDIANNAHIRVPNANNFGCRPCKIFSRRRAWEQYYLNFAAREKGCIIFWLPGEKLKKEDENKIYAHITMLELGEWIARKAIDPDINLIIGTDGHFPQWSTIEYEINTEIQDIKIFYSMREVVDEAIKAINK